MEVDCSSECRSGNMYLVGDSSGLGCTNSISSSSNTHTKHLFMSDENDMVTVLYAVRQTNQQLPCVKA